MPSNPNIPSVINKDFKPKIIAHPTIAGIKPTKISEKALNMLLSLPCPLLTSLFISDKDASFIPDISIKAACTRSTVFVPNIICN